MARDYAKTRSGKGRRRRRPAARPKRTGPPGWVWLFCGLCLGLAIAAGVYIFGRPAGEGGGAGAPAPPPDAASGEAEAAESTEPRFSFYEMLPNYEIVIPEEEYTQKAGPDEQKTTPKVREPGQYVIQAGSFSNYEDADRRKAGLALLGVESRIEQVELDTGRTVYRVRTGPVSDVEQLNRTLKQLGDNGIDTLVMRHKE